MVQQGKIERALIAVWDKEGVVAFARALEKQGVEILSTGGTAQKLRDGGVEVRKVEEVTDYPEMMGGRIKTLHPRIHGGILARRHESGDLESMREHGIPAIDLVVINLYPFEQTVAAGASFSETIEQIDIGGPAMVRAAAKNHADVAVVVDPGRYDGIIAEMNENDGCLGEGTRKQLALEAFSRTAAYDAAISNWFGEELAEGFPPTWSEQWQLVQGLRYGENPHQQAAWYSRSDGDSFSFSDISVLGGKELSYNNLLDAASAIECCRGLEGPAAVVVKHCLPCGAAEKGTLGDAFEAALAGDPLSAFGGILAFSETLSAELAERIASPDLFFEVIHAPKFGPGAAEAIRNGARWGKNCRLLEGGGRKGEQRPFDLRSIPGGMLMQQRDVSVTPTDEFRVVSSRQPTPEEWDDLLFGWRVLPHVRSNGILLARERSVVGVGAGQPSRVDSVKIACQKAPEKVQGSALASDAFFPFPDGIETAAAAGVSAVIQPGGSVRDEAVIEAANNAQVAMVLTGERHFRH